MHAFNRVLICLYLLWDVLAYYQKLVVNALCQNQNSKLALMVYLMWKAHIYNPALMEHVLCELHPCNSPLIECILGKHMTIWQYSWCNYLQWKIYA